MPWQEDKWGQCVPVDELWRRNGRQRHVGGCCWHHDRSRTTSIPPEGPASAPDGALPSQPAASAVPWARSLRNPATRTPTDSEYWGVPASDAHSAAGDARTTLAVVRRLAQPTGFRQPRREEQPAAAPWKSGGAPWGSSEPALANEPAEKALSAMTRQELREAQRQIKEFDVAARQARELFVRIESGIDANNVPSAIRELDAVKLQFADSRNYHPRSTRSRR